jgi:uncharacterized membrane protein
MQSLSNIKPWSLFNIYSIKTYNHIFLPWLLFAFGNFFKMGKINRLLSVVNQAREKLKILSIV